MSRRLALLGFATGCNLVFPLEPEPEAPETLVVNGRLVETRIEAGGAAVVRGETPVTDAAMMVRFEDGTSTSVSVAADGAFSFERPTQRYRVVLVRGLDTFELQEEASELLVGYLAIGRAAPPSPPGAFLSLPMPTTGTSATLALTGQWARLDRPEMLVDWTKLTDFDGRPVGQFSSIAGDRAYFLEFADGALRPGQRALSRVIEADPFEAAGNIIHALAGPSKAISENRSVHVSSTLDLPTTRFFDAAIASNPAAWSPATQISALRAVPAPELSTEGFELVTELGMDQPYQTDLVGFDPFEDHETLAVAATITERSYAHPQAVGGPFKQFAGVEQAVAIEGPEVVIDRAAAIPRNVRFADTPLVSDLATITVPRNETATLSWEVTPGSVDYYDIVLFELVGDFGVSRLDLVQRYRTRERSIAIETAPLRPAKIYGFIVVPVYGAPDAATGDYLHRSLPSGFSIHPTAVFVAL